jgi:hypothetical protein
MSRQRQQQYAAPPGMMSRRDDGMSDTVSIRTQDADP